MARIWGFDLGTSSVGFAVIDYDEGSSQGKLVRVGVRVFPEGVDEKKKEPRNAVRRAKRLARRQFRRRRWRKRHMRELLVDAGLLPASERKPRSHQGRDDFFLNSDGADPYRLRARAVNERIEPFEIGRVLFHLCKHRGFTGSRKFDTSRADDRSRASEERQIRQEIEDLRRQLAGRTLGEYLHGLPPTEAKRRRHIHRDMVQDEFRRIWDKQRTFYPDLLTDDLRERIWHTLFAQRPTFFSLKTIGKCELEPDERRCLKGDWHAQRFVMLQMLNNLRFLGDRQLSAEQRERLLNELEAKASLTFDQIRKKLGLGDERFNFESGGEKRIIGNATECELAKVFGRQWETLPARDRIRAEIAERLWHLEYRQVGDKRAEIRTAAQWQAERDAFVKSAMRDWSITAEQAESLSKLDLPAGYVMHSKRAILKMLPYLEQGLRYDEAKDRAYPKPPPAGPPAEKLSEPDPNRVRNPTVIRTLGELQKVVNNLLRVDGRPDLIRIELARDLKLPRTRRLKLMAEQRQNEKRRKDARDELARRGLPVTHENVEKYLLANEQGWRCPYSGKQISCDGLFQSGLFEVDHILPRSRSFEDSFANKVVCHRDANKEKGNRTPFEAWGADPERWAAIEHILSDIQKHAGFPISKVDRIKRKEFPALGGEDFTNRQLVDSAYIARMAVDYLSELGVKVEPTNGRVTAHLRRLWGLETILSDAPEGKNRDDHRHHAVDAIAVALTTPAFVKRLSDYYGTDRTPDRERFRVPWDSLRADAERAVAEIVVSHRAQRKVSGALHDENPWRDTGEESEENGIRYRLYSQRKSSGQRAVEPIQQKLMKPVGPDRAAWVATNSNHHILIYKDEAGELRYETVSMFDAAMRISKRQPIVDRSRPQAAPFRSLCIGDMIERTVDGRKTYWTVKKLSANGQITIQPHNFARDLGRTSPSVTTLVREGARKVVVDPIGRVSYAND